jgi:hypothetical protein
MSRKEPRILRWVVFAGIPVVLGGLVLAYFLFFRAASGGAGDAGKTLFIIQRNKNANEVHYDVNVGADGQLGNEPVVAYWIMKAERGQREDLTFLEAKKAYGVEVKGSGDGREIKLAAWEDRKVHLKKAGDRWRALTKIDGKDAYLTRLFIQSEEGGVTPNVLWIDVFGEAVDGGKEVKEHVVKK